MFLRTLPLSVTVLLLASQLASAQCTEQAKVLAWDGASSEQFANAVALSGQTALLGKMLDGVNGPESGSVYVFTHSGSAWVGTQKLVPEDGAPGDKFGVDLAAADDVAVIGARGCDDAAADAGAAYVYRRTAPFWAQETKLLAPDADAQDQFGIAVDVDADVVVVGANLDDDRATNAGAVYVFRNTGAGWTLEAKLTASDGGSGDHFGIAVAVSGDAIAVGAQLHDDGAVDTGAAYIFRHDNGTWVQEYKLQASDGGVWDRFGSAVDIDGDAVIVGAYLHDNAELTNAGAAYVFRYDASGWLEEAKLSGSGAQQADKSGIAVALSGDVAVVGAYTANNGIFDDAGAAYVFGRAEGDWIERAKLFASDGVFFDNFGNAVALTPEFLLVGSVSDSNSNGPDAGAAYVFEQCTPGSACVLDRDCADLDGDGVRDDSCTWSACSNGTCQHLDIGFADLGGARGACLPDDVVDAHDRFHALDCFSNIDTLGGFGYPCEDHPPDAVHADAGGEFGDRRPDGVCDAHDVFHLLSVFSGLSRCGCDGPSPRRVRPRASRDR